MNEEIIFFCQFLKVNFGLPCHQLELDYIRSFLSFLVAIYDVPVLTEVAQISNTGEEMELYSYSLKVFRNVFNEQETMLNFPVYDSLTAQVPCIKFFV